MHPISVPEYNTIVGLACIATICGIALLVRSKRHAHELPTIPTLFPWLGIDNAIACYRNPGEFMECARLRYGPFYQFVVGGTNIAVLMQPFSLRQLERESSEITDHLPIEMSVTAASGLKESQHIVDVLVDQLTPITTRELSPAAIANSGMRPMFNEALARELDILVQSSNGTVLLKDLICKPMYSATSFVLFGPTFPFHTYKDFLVLNESIPLLTSPLSRLPIFEPSRARKRLLGELVNYMSTWWDSDGEERIEGASRLTMEFLHALKGSGLTIEDAAAGILAFTWGVHNNVWYHLYWLMAHTLVDDKTRKMVEKEARASPSPGCAVPFIESLCHESLRWPFTIGQVRKATNDLHLTLGKESYFVRQGTWILTRNTNQSASTYSDPDQFRPNRFLDSSVSKPQTYGNGRHMCKGRHFSQIQFPDYVAQCFRKFEIRAHVENKQPARLPEIIGNPFLPDVATIEDFLVDIKPVFRG